MLPLLRFTFVHRGGDSCMSVAQHTDLAKRLFGSCDAKIQGRYRQGPDKDTFFEVIETATMVWVPVATPRPAQTWETTVEWSDATQTWWSSHTHASLTLAGADDAASAFGAYEAARLALRPLGYRPLHWLGDPVDQALSAAGAHDARARWQRARLEALVDPEPLHDPMSRGLAAEGFDEEGIVEIAQRATDPGFYAVLNLRRNSLTSIPATLDRFSEVVRIDLQGNPALTLPSPAALRAMFPKLQLLDLRGCPVTSAQIEALRAAGYRVEADPGP
jgi:hypothetical protein